MKVVRHGYLKKNDSLFEIKRESSGLRRAVAILLCPLGQSHISASGINRKKRPEAEALQKSKNQHRFLSRIGGKWGAEIAAFLLVSNIKIRC